MLTSQPCSHTFGVLTSLHLLSFLLKMIFIILVSIVFLNGGIFFCRLQKYWCKYKNHTIIIALTLQCLHHNYIHRHNYKACSSLKVSILCISIIYELIIILIHLQTMTIFISFTALSAVHKTCQSLCHPLSIPMLIVY